MPDSSIASMTSPEQGAQQECSSTRAPGTGGSSASRPGRDGLSASSRSGAAPAGTAGGDSRNCTRGLRGGTAGPGHPGPRQGLATRCRPARASAVIATIVRPTLARFRAAPVVVADLALRLRVAPRARGGAMDAVTRVMLPHPALLDEIHRLPARRVAMAVLVPVLLLAGWNVEVDGPPHVRVARRGDDDRLGVDDRRPGVADDDAPVDAGLGDLDRDRSGRERRLRCDGGRHADRDHPGCEKFHADLLSFVWSAAPGI